jgi:hypothetical protein
MAVSAKPKTYLVECFWTGVDERKLASAVTRAQAAASELRLAGHQLEFLGSILVRSDETAFFLFEGAEEDVREASERADVPFERVLESVQIEGGPKGR